MRISDWSSDVCSSDLIETGVRRFHFGKELFELAVCQVPRFALANLGKPHFRLRGDLSLLPCPSYRGGHHQKLIANRGWRGFTLICVALEHLVVDQGGGSISPKSLHRLPSDFAPWLVRKSLV